MLEGIKVLSFTHFLQGPSAVQMLADVGALPLGGFPQFTSDTGRVFYHDATGLVSVLWDGSDRKVVLAGATPQTVRRRLWRRG